MSSNGETHQGSCCCIPTPCRQCTPRTVWKVIGKENHSLEEREDCLVLNMFPTTGVRLIAKLCCLIIIPPIWLNLLVMGAATTTLYIYKDGRVWAEFKTNLYSFWYDFANVASKSTYESLSGDESGSISTLLAVHFRNGRIQQTEILMLDLPEVFFRIRQYLDPAHQEAKELQLQQQI